MSTIPIEVFYSYEERDAPLLEELEKHLRLLQREGLITPWHKRHITAGLNWKKTLDQHLNTASVVLLLISADFVASDYCYGVEMQRAMERYEAGEALVIPILLRPADWQSTLFAKIQALPSNGVPVTRWNDQDEAFVDVAQGIRVALRKIQHLALEIPSTIFPRIWNVPYTRNPFFIGRERLMGELAEALQTSKVTTLSQPQAISGLGGIGKTQIAVEYAYRHQEDYQAVLWVLADTRENLVSSYFALARLLHLPEQENQESDLVIVAVKHWLQCTPSWLLILDNADDLALAHEFMPPVFKGHILLTTRARVSLRFARCLEVDILSTEVGALFLLRRAGILTPESSLDQATLAEQDTARAICEELGGLPLALDQAGAYLEETRYGLSDYQQRYQQRRIELLAERRGFPVDDHPHPVATTWSLSFEKVERQNPFAAELLRFCAFLAPDAIPLEIILDVAPDLGLISASINDNEFLLDKAIDVLHTYSLARLETNRSIGHTLSIHRLVQAVLQDTMTVEARRQWAERAVRAMNTVFPRVDYSTWKQALPYLSHVEIGTSLIERYVFTFSEAGALLYAYGRYLYFTAQYEQAELFYRQALDIFDRVLGPKHSSSAATLQELARLLQMQGKYGPAESAYQQALDIQKQVLGPEHPGTAATLQELAGLLQAQGQYEQALPLYLSVLSIREGALGPQHPETATTLHELAQLFQAQGQHNQAELFYQQALHIKEQNLGALDPSTAATLQGLAGLFQILGQYKRADRLYQQALHIREDTLGLEHPSTATTLHGWAQLFQVQGLYEKADQFYQRALHIREQKLGPKHLDVATSFNGLASLYYTKGQYAQAEQLYLQSFTIRELWLEPEHPDIATSLNNLAKLYWSQGKYAEAEPLYMRALQICEQKLGAQHPDTALSLNNLALLYESQGKYAQAEPLLVRALAIYEQELGAEHPDTASSLNNLAALYANQGKYAQAEPLYERALAIREQQLGAEHPDTATSLNNLALLYKNQGKYVQAEPLYVRALAIFEKILGQSHPSAQIVRANYASLLQAMKHDGEAKPGEQGF